MGIVRVGQHQVVLQFYSKNFNFIDAASQPYKIGEFYMTKFMSI